jgi:hypothetical protein
LAILLISAVALKLIMSSPIAKFGKLLSVFPDVDSPRTDPGRSQHWFARPGKGNSRDMPRDSNKGEGVKKKIMQPGIDFPSEWAAEALKTFEKADKNIHEVATPSALDTAYKHLRHGFLVRIEDGKMYVNADKEIQSTKWRQQLESSKAPSTTLCPILETLCNRNFNRNIDFMFNLADEPVGSYNDTPLPAFSWVKSNLNSDLLVPYPFWYSNISREKPENCDFTEEIESSWNSKKNIGIWRGSTTGIPKFTEENWREQWRPKLVLFCNANPDICDAKISFFCQAKTSAIKQMRQELGGENRMTMDAQSTYKYAILLDGNSAPSSRMLSNLQSSSLIIKQESPFIEFFYPSLLPYYHYVPIPRSIEAVRSAIEWARENQEEVKDMIASARKFACTHLNKDTIENYIEYLFDEYASRFEGIRSTIPADKFTLISVQEGYHALCPGFTMESCPLLRGDSSLS